MQHRRLPHGKKLGSDLLNPTLCIVAFLVFWAFWVGISYSVLIKILLFVVISPVIACLAVFLFLSSIDRLGQKTYSTPSLPLFRAFMLDWAVGLNAPLEELFEKTGENADIEVNSSKI